MLKIITQLSMFLVGALAQSQVSETREMQHFSKIIVNDGVELVLTQSGTSELVAQAPDALSLNDLVTEVKDETLYVYTKDELEGDAKVYISLSELSSISVSENSQVSLTNELNMPELQISLASHSIFTGNVNASKLGLDLKAGSFFNGNLTAREFSAAIDGKSTARLSGWAVNATINASHGSKCFAKTLYTSVSALDASGNSQIAANVEKEVRVKITEGSQISWAGYPTSTTLPEDARILKSNTTAITGI